MRTKQSVALMIASFYRPLARHGIPDETVNILDCLDLRLDNTHALHITATVTVSSNGLYFMTQ
jgi:hypothetical protein